MERYFDENEVVKAPALVRDLMREVAGIIRDGDFGLVKTMISDAIGKGHYRRDRYGINPVIHSLETSLALCRMVSPDRNMVLAVAADNLKHEGSLYEFANMMSVSLPERIYLQDLMERYQVGMATQSNDGQPSLFDFDNLLS